MLATVFFMQPLGQISSNLVALVAITITRNRGGANLTRSIDIMWRWVIGIGVLPGVIALIFRVFIPETPRFFLDIEDDPIKAEFDTTQMFGDLPLPELELGSPALRASGGPFRGSKTASQASGPGDYYSDDAIRPVATPAAPSPDPVLTQSGAPITTLNAKWTLSRKDIIRYFWHEGNWRTLLATSLSWLLLDFGFYGIGLSSPQFLARTWGNLRIDATSPFWMTDDTPGASVFQMFMDTSVQALVILNAGSFAGGLLLIYFANRLNRVSLQKYGFLVLTALFVALGVVFLTGKETGKFVIALYVVGQLAFNLGQSSPFFVSSCLADSLTLAALDRPQRHDVHPGVRSLPDTVPGQLRGHLGGRGQAGLDSGAGLLGLLPVQLEPAPVRHRPGHLQRRHGPGRRRHARLHVPGAGPRHGPERAARGAGQGPRVTPAGHRRRGRRAEAESMLVGKGFFGV